MQLRRIQDLFHSRQLWTRPIRLGDPRHGLVRCGWAQIGVRLAKDGNGLMFEEWVCWQYGDVETATWWSERSPVISPVGKNHIITYSPWMYSEQEEYDLARHGALLHILCKENDSLLG